MAGNSSQAAPAPDDDPNFVEYDSSGRYGRYDEVMGRGSYKIVYRAFDERDGLEVAWNKVKMLDVVSDEEDTDDINSEVHFLRTLSHKNIIKYYGSWFDPEEKIVNVITELFTSGTLRHYRMKHKRVEARALKNWARQILEGLLYLHSQDPPVIHRDIKCDNVFINGNHGEVKIGDLGLAAILCKTGGSAHSVLGTPEFMAPELYKEDYNELVDIYAFGMCLLEMETLEYPYVECANAVQIYKKVIEGVKPLSLEKVRDSQMKEFIKRCIAEVSVRCSARDLLEDPFLKFDIADEVEEYSPLSCSSGNGSARAGANGPFSELGNKPQKVEHTFTVESSRTDANTLCLKLSIPDETGDHVQNILFAFDTRTDTAMSVATEMVAELGLNAQDVTSIAAIIESEVEAHASAEDLIEFDVGDTAADSTSLRSDEHESTSLSNDASNNEDPDNFILEKLLSDASSISDALVLSPTEQMKKVIDKVESKLQQPRNGCSERSFEYGAESLELLPKKLEMMLKKQYRELSELKCKHKQELQDLLQEMPANDFSEMIKLCFPRLWPTAHLD